ESAPSTRRARPALEDTKGARSKRSPGWACGAVDGGGRYCPKGQYRRPQPNPRVGARPLLRAAKTSVTRLRFSRVFPFVFFLLGAVLAGCTSLPPMPERTPSTALANTQGTGLGALAA